MNVFTLHPKWMSCGICFILFSLFSTNLLSNNINYGGTVISNQTICFGEDPSLLNSTNAAGGGDANLAIEYLWMRSVPGVSDWAIIEGATDASYDPPALNQTTAFIRCARRAGFENYTGESNVILITVLPGPIAIITQAPTGGVNGEVLNFSGFASTSDATLVWDFGDGTTATGMNVSHVFEYGGDKVVTLTATNPYNGCSSSERVTFFLLGPLPVELDYFYAETTRFKTVELIWATQSEENNRFFEIQKSIDGQRFENIGYVEGFGTTNQSQDYLFVDDIPFSGINYYRLKQVDFNGEFSFSEVIVVRVDKEDQMEFTLFPNPVIDELNIRFKDHYESDALILIKNVNNQIILESSISAGALKSDFDLSQLPSGIYSFTIWSKDIRSTQLFVKSGL